MRDLQRQKTRKQLLKKRTTLKIDDEDITQKSDVDAASVRSETKSDMKK